LKIDSVDKKFYCLECGNFSQDTGTPGTESHCVFTAGGERVNASSNFKHIEKHMCLVDGCVIKIFVLLTCSEAGGVNPMVLRKSVNTSSSMAVSFSSVRGTMGAGNIFAGKTQIYLRIIPLPHSKH
jgi:hypothetical protein